MGNDKESVWSKLVGKVRKNFMNDDTADLTDKERMDMEKLIRERKLELIASKRLRDLEKKYAPKEKTSVNDTFAKIKAYRQQNLSRRENRIKQTEYKKEKFKNMEKSRYGNSMPKPQTSSIGQRCRELEMERKERVLRARRY
jgi:hypothetical protein